MATPKKPTEGTPVSAKRGKIKGTASVTPKSETDQAPPVAPETKPGEGEKEYNEAFDAGVEASKRGAPTRPPLGYSLLEVKGWYAGYKSHANPQAGGPVKDIDSGFRKDY